MSLVRNEQTKLTATYMNGVAIALFAVGGLAPLLSGLYGTGDIPPFIFVGAGICIVASGALHFGARQFLRKLVP